MPDNQTNRRLEVVMAFSTDATKATAGLEAIATGAKKVDAAAKGAQKALEGIGGPAGVGASGVPNTSPNFPTTAVGPDGKRYSYSAYSGAQRDLASQAASKEKADALAAISGKGTPGAGGGMLDLIGKGAAAFAVIGTLTKGLEALGDSSQTTQGQVMGLIKSVPIAGDAIAGLVTGITKFAERDMRKKIADDNWAAGIYDAQQNNRAAGDQKLMEARRSARETVSSARGFFGGRYAVPVEGEDMRVTQAKMEVERTRREALAAMKDYGAYGKDLATSNTGVRINQQFATQAALEAKKAQDRLDAARGKASSAGNVAFEMARGVNVAQTAYEVGSGKYNNLSELNGVRELGEANLQRKDLTRALVVQENNLNAAKDKSLAVTTKLAEYEKARTDVLRAEADVLKDKYGNAKNRERAAGGMSDEAKQAVVSALEEVRSKGWGRASGDARDLVMSSPLTAEWAAKQAEAFGAQDRTLQYIQSITGERSSKDLMKELQNVSAQIDVKIQVDEQRLSKALMDTLNEFVKQLTINVTEQTKALNETIKDEAVKQKKMQAANFG